MFDVLGRHIGQGKYGVWVQAFGKPIHDEYMDKELFCDANACFIDCCCASPRYP